MAIEEKTQRHYSRSNGRAYNHSVIQQFSKPKLDWILTKTTFEKKKVLEVGAGNGYFSHLLTKICDLTVLDISKFQLNSNPAQKKHVGSVYELPFPDNSFDTVFSSNLLHHLDNPQKAMNEMKRVAKSQVIIIEPNRKSPPVFIGALLSARERGACKYSKDFVAGVIQKSGLKIRNHTYFGGFVMPNATPTFLLPIAGARSKNSLSFFQIFICEKVK